jgi:hypothetical protein
LKEGTNVIRNEKGQSYLALVYKEQSGFNRSYDLLTVNNSVADWEKYRLSHKPQSNIVMATITRAANLDGHAKIPAVTYRQKENFSLITGTTGSATECARMLGIKAKKGDTEDIADWIVSRGLENLTSTMSQIAEIPCSMNMVFTLVDNINDHITVHLLRSKSKDGYGKPYFAYSYTNAGLVYSSKPEEADQLLSTESKTLEEQTVLSFKFGKAE